LQNYKEVILRSLPEKVVIIETPLTHTHDDFDVQIMECSEIHSLADTGGKLRAVT